MSSIFTYYFLGLPLGIAGFVFGVLGIRQKHRRADLHGIGWSYVLLLACLLTILLGIVIPVALGTAFAEAFQQFQRQMERQMQP